MVRHARRLSGPIARGGSGHMTKQDKLCASHPFGKLKQLLCQLQSIAQSRSNEMKSIKTHKRLEQLWTFTETGSQLSGTQVDSFALGSSPALSGNQRAGHSNQSLPLFECPFRRGSYRLQQVEHCLEVRDGLD